jgi:hypothetical protein
VEVIAAHLEPSGIVGKAEADHRPGGVVEVEDPLFGDDLGKRPVGRTLARHRARMDELELTLDPQRAGGGAGGNAGIEGGAEVLVAERLGELEVE